MSLAVVTGASSGIGLSTALALARAGSSLVLVSRAPERAADRVRAEAKGEVRTLVADLSVRAEVDRVAAALREGPPIDVLVNNAGAMFWSYAETPDGVERTWALDYLAPYVLTRSVLDHVRDGGRVVNVASRLHDAPLDPDDPNGDFGPLRAYARAKLALILFTNELARREPRISTNAVYPGDVKTNAAGNAPWPVRALYRVIASTLYLTPDQGAEAVVRAATDPALAGTTGQYFDRLVVGRSSPRSTDPELARRLWEATARRTGLPG